MLNVLVPSLFSMLHECLDKRPLQLITIIPNKNGQILCLFNMIIGGKCAHDYVSLEGMGIHDFARKSTPPPGLVVNKL